MSAAFAITRETANSGAASPCGKSADPLRLMTVVTKRLRELFPVKTAAHIAARSRGSVRSAEYWLAGTYEMPAEAFIRLLQSEEGAEVLDAVMTALPSRERPRWWRRHTNTARLAAIEVAQANHEAEIKQLRLDLLK